MKRENNVPKILLVVVISIPVFLCLLGTLFYLKLNHFENLLFYYKGHLVPLRLISKRSTHPDFYEFTFELPKKYAKSGIQPGQYVQIIDIINGDIFKRFYTPFSSDYIDNDIKVGVKVIDSNKNNSSGVMERNLITKNAEIDHIYLKGPYGSFYYIGNGTFNMKKGKTLNVNTISMYSEGTGITQMVSIIRTLLGTLDNDISIKLLYTAEENRNIYLEDYLKNYTNITNSKSDRFTTNYVFQNSKNLNQTNYETKLTNNTIMNNMFPISENHLTLISGSTYFNDWIKNTLISNFGDAFLKNVHIFEELE